MWICPPLSFICEMNCPTPDRDLGSTLSGGLGNGKHILVTETDRFMSRECGRRPVLEILTCSLLLLLSFLIPPDTAKLFGVPCSHNVLQERIEEQAKSVISLLCQLQ